MNLVTSGYYDSFLEEYCNFMKTWLSGDDGVYGTADDRRVHLRFAHGMK